MSTNVLITGGTSGIGLATAEQFVRHGYSVMICGRDPDRRQAAEKQLQQLAQQWGRKHADQPEVVVASLPCDLKDVQQCSDLADKAIALLGSVDILINNASAAPLCDFENTSIEDFEHVLSVNLRATWTLTQKIWKDMAKAKQGIVVNISSMAAIDPFTGFSLYGASKGWIETWTKALADEGQRKGIRVYGIRPGAVETPMLRRLFPDYPAQQCVAPTEIAEAIFDLAIHQSHPPGTILTVQRTSNPS